MSQVFAVRGLDFLKKKHTVITSANSREGAKSNAVRYIGTDPDQYVVEPLTDPGDDKVFIDLTVSLA
jgi:hypothetical protein